MKKVFTFLTTVLITAILWAQSPEKMSYQAVIRNSSNTLVTNTKVGMQISILQGSASGTAVYVETQTPTTNTNGLVSIEIGAGTIISGDFSTIDWANNSYFIKTETDPSGGTDYTITGISQLLSVPYALHAKTAEKLSGTVTETDPVFKASAAASVTNAGSGSIITNEERKRWNNAIPDTIMHPENGIYEGGLIGSYQTYQTVYTEGTESTKRKHVLVFLSTK